MRRSLSRRRMRWRRSEVVIDRISGSSSGSSAAGAGAAVGAGAGAGDGLAKMSSASMLSLLASLIF